MKLTTRVVLMDRHYIAKTIAKFYLNAKTHKYNHSYSWEDVFKDIELAYQDRKLIPTNKTTPKWFDAGFNVARNNRGWAFAYRIEQDTLYIYDAENCRNLTTEYRNTEPFVLAQGISTNNKQCFSINYKVTACRKEDGYIYLFKDNQQLPGYRFNEIIKPFYKYKSGEIYAIGEYGGKKFKITLDGVVRTLNEMRLRRIVRQVLTEVFNRRIGFFTS